MITALALMTLVAIVFASLTALTRAEHRHTRHVAEEAQLRHMLLAGQMAAHSRLDDDSSWATSQTVPLPATLADDGGVLTLHVESNAPQRRRVRIEARLGERTARQAVQYERSNGQWQMHSAALIRTR